MDKLNSLISHLYDFEIKKVIENIKAHSSIVSLTSDFMGSISNSVAADLSVLWMQCIKLENQYIKRTKGEEYNGSIYTLLLEDDKYRKLFLSKYRNLSKISSARIINIESFMFDLIDFIVEDLSELSLNFGIENLNIGEFNFLGDSHFGGRKTLRIMVDNKNLIFKPRSTLPEEFFNCIAKLTELNTYKVLTKADHGWCQYLDHDAVAINESVHYYLGAMQALTHFTSTKDAHKENIIIHNSKPYLIDAECTINCSLDITNRRFYNSNNIYDYGIIPFYWKENNYSNRNVSYLGNLYAGLDVNIEDVNLWRQEFIEGYSGTYNLLINNFTYIESIISHYCQDMSSRIVLRNTSFYSTLLRLIHNPVYMFKNRNSVVLEVKGRLYRKGLPQELISYETSSLLNGDIPYFYSPICQNKIIAYSHQNVFLPFKNNLLDTFMAGYNKENYISQMKKQKEILGVYFDVECIKRKGLQNERQ